MNPNELLCIGFTTNDRECGPLFFQGQGTAATYDPSLDLQGLRQFLTQNMLLELFAIASRPFGYDQV